MLASRHETIFQRSEAEGAGRHRRGNTQGGGREDLLRVGADRKALAQEAPGDRGRAAKRAIPGRPSKKGEMLQQWLPEQLKANHDVTLEEHGEAFEEGLGVAVSASTVGQAIARLPGGGWPIKKSPR